jgi:mono/diheme cytochrome c family protein
LLSVLLYSVALAGTTGPQQPEEGKDAAGTAAIWRGVFTEDQAERGRVGFEANCAHCHDGKLAEAPTLTADPFLRNWEGHNLERLFSKIRDEMPPGPTESVTPSQKLDILAYLLQENGFPAGTRQLEADTDTLARLWLVPEGGPAPLQTGATVQLVGCLVLGRQAEWMLTHSSEPVATTLTPQTPEQLEAADAQALGGATIRLLSVFPSPIAQEGHHVEAKGFLVRKGPDVALNVALLRTIAVTCP